MPHKRTLLTAFFLSLLLLTLSQTDELTVSAQRRDGDNSTIYQTVDLEYLSKNLQKYEGSTIQTTGIVISEGYGSIFMFEDFWLQSQNNANAKIMIALSKGLSVPSNSQLITILGKIEHSNIEGGFYFLNSSSWIILNSQTPTTTPKPYSTPEPTITPTISPTLETSQPANPITNNPNNPSSTFLGQYGFTLIILEVIAIAIGGFIVYLIRNRKLASAKNIT